ncbi:hypothetical protein NQ317_013070 [Molorchus minor]|uniref:Uncharacterized protein n=1 Tax=Molorchus minor TaxID=1323400 RepID=A0ABQ9JRC4_9CUCU|nr:hypothetical protein NQ317_013070 [Molorchus minor]
MQLNLPLFCDSMHNFYASDCLESIDRLSIQSQFNDVIAMWHRPPDQFKLTQKQQSAINDICLFLHVLQKKVPFHDLQFCKELMKYKTIDASISKAACGKINNHLWYLNPENVSLSFFDENILIDDKKEMFDN